MKKITYLLIIFSIIIGGGLYIKSLDRNKDVEKSILNKSVVEFAQVQPQKVDQKKETNKNIEKESNINNLVEVTMNTNTAYVYKNFSDLKKDAEIAIIGEVLDQSYFDRQSSTFTKSRVLVEKSFLPTLKKGDIIYFAEMGGITTQEHIYNTSGMKDKFGEMSTEEKEKARNTKVKVTLENSQAMNPGERVLIFGRNAFEFYNDEVYSILGAYQGKFKVNSDYVQREIKGIDPLKTKLIDLDKEFSNN